MKSNAPAMPALVHYDLKANHCEIREVPVPEIGPDDVLLRIKAVGICGSDVHQYHNTHSWKVNIPVVLGHEFGGIVEAVGENVAEFAPGDRVVSETAAVIDAASPFSRTGAYHLDPSRLGFGYGVDGAMAPYVRAPARCLHRVPEGVDFVRAALTEPCAVAYQATVVNSPIKPGASAIVIGPGPIGLLCAHMAKIAGAAEVIVVGLEKDRPRLELALRHFATGVATVEEIGSDPDGFRNRFGDGYGADVIIDAAGVSSALKLALDWVRPGGHITKVGWGPQPLGFSLDPLVQKAVTLQGSFSHTWAVWENVLKLMSSGRLDPMPIVSKTAPLDDWKDGFDGMANGRYVKAVLLPNGDPDAA